MIWLVLLSLAGYLFYKKFVKPLSIWKDRDIPHRRAWPVVGNAWREMCCLVSFPDGLIDNYKDFHDKRYNGYVQFNEPMILLRDLELIKQISVKHFDHFTDHLVRFDPKIDPLFSKNLFSMKGQSWKDMRSTLSPIFTSAKLKGMFPFMNQCGEQFTQYFLNQKEDLIIMDAKDSFSRFSNDVIASTAFGISCDSLKNKENKFFVTGKKITDISGFQAIKFMMTNIAPEVLTILRIPIIPTKVSNYFKSIIINNMKEREEKGIVRPDLIHLLMQAKKGLLKHEDSVDPDAGFATVQESAHGKGEINLELTDELLTAQAMIFFFAGFDTVSTGMSYAAYELALNQDIQDKLREEIEAVLEESNGKLSYDQVIKMKYLDMVVSETLRKWPPGFILDRECTKEFTIQPERDGEKPFVVKPGDVVFIPAYAIHRDPKYYPNPEKFDPERFNDENKGNILPYAYFPFGLGPRACIGSRFALLEIKILIIQLLLKFNIEVVHKTPIPFQFETGSFMFNPKGGMWLGLRTRK